MKSNNNNQMINMKPWLGCKHLCLADNKILCDNLNGILTDNLKDFQTHLLVMKTKGRRLHRGGHQKPNRAYSLI